MNLKKTQCGTNTPAITHVIYLAENSDRNPISGAENQILLLVDELAKAGADIHLIIMLWSNENNNVINGIADRLQSDGVKITFIQKEKSDTMIGNWLKILKALSDLFLLLRKHKDRIIHLHLDLIYTPIIAWLAGCRKIIITVHNDEPYYSKTKWKIWLHCLSVIVYRFIGITKHVSQYFQTVSGETHGKITTIYYGLHRPTSDVSLKRSEYGLKADDFVVGFVGRLTEQKNLHNFIRALSQTPEIIGVIIGSGPQQEYLKQIVRQEKITNVQFWGPIPNAASIMTLFDVFCLPSSWEGLGLVLIESMMQKVPIIGCCRGAIPEILEHGKYGILFEPDSDSIARALKISLSSYNELISNAGIAYEHAMQHFNVQGLRQNYIHFYQRL